MIKVIFSNDLRRAETVVEPSVIVKDFMDEWGLVRDLSTHGVFVNGVPLFKPELDARLGNFAVHGVVHLVSVIKHRDINNRGIW